MLIWIFVELAVIQGYSFLQAIYFGLGIAELTLILTLLGIAAGTLAIGHAGAGHGSRPGLSR